MGKPVVIKILGDASSLTRSIEISQTAISRLGGAAKAATIGLGLAGATIATQVTKSALNFENEMASVFTLLPGITQDSMSLMSDQVLDFSKDMGIVPSEVIPALYDALSAGVPQDNVFEFLETAGKAAIGGNLEVQASVDLLSTAVNAYSESGLTAAEASDLFFTTVRLGKTTVPELQGAFSQVGPVAAALGVSLDEVGASLAVLTASGVPTAGAATQIRAAIAELGKTGTIAARSFEEINGTSFPEFIEAGGSFEDALMSMSESGGSLIDMFGSIEAAQGVMALTANGGASLASAISEMGSAAGATDAAFGTMDATTARSFDKIKANFSAVSVEIGNKVLPKLAQLTDYIVENWPAIEAAVIPVLKGIQLWIVSNWPKVQEAFRKVVDFVIEHWPTISHVMEEVKDFIGQRIVPAVVKAIEVLWDIGTAVVGWFERNWPKINNAFQVVRDFIVEDALPVIRQAIENLQETFETIFGALAEFWDNWGEEIKATTARVWEEIKNYFGAVWAVIDGAWQTFKSAFEGDWRGMWEGIQKIFEGLWNGLKATFNAGWSLFKLAYHFAVEAFKSKSGEVVDAVVEFFKALPGRIKDAIVAQSSKIVGVGAELMGWIGQGIESAAVSVGQAIWDSLPGAVQWGLEYGAGGLSSLSSLVGSGSPVDGLQAQADAALRQEQALLAASTYGRSQPRAHGGPITGSMIVGERGPELLRLDNSIGGGSVIANEDMPQGMSSGVYVHVEGSVSTAQEIGEEVMWQLMRASG